jgi:type I restriction enzyme M protein
MSIAAFLHEIEDKLKTGQATEHTYRSAVVGTRRSASAARSPAEHLLDAVIGLPPNLFYGTGIPAAILLFRRDKAESTVVFIDASRAFAASPNQNRLREADIARIVQTFRQRQSVDKYAYVATAEELQENDYNLNIPRYVDTFEEEEQIDIAAVQADIDALDAKYAQVQAQMHAYLRELGLQ